MISLPFCQFQICRLITCLHHRDIPYFGPCVQHLSLWLPGTQNVPYFRMHVKQICGVGNKLIIRLQTHHRVSLVRYASSVHLLGSSWGIAKLVCFHATTILLLTYSWIGTSVTSWTLCHHLVLFTLGKCKYSTRWWRIVHDVKLKYLFEHILAAMFPVKCQPTNGWPIQHGGNWWCLATVLKVLACDYCLRPISDQRHEFVAGWQTKKLVPICFYCVKCTKFGQLILRKIIKIVVTRCQILRLKCTKFDFGWGSAPDPGVGAYSAPPDPLAGFKVAHF